MLHGRHLAIALLISGCGLSTANQEDGRDDSIGTDGKADGGYSAAEISGALRVANEVALADLDDDVGLSSRAANNIVAHRTGADGTEGTADDSPFTTLGELDAVPYVGPVALTHLVDHARSLGWIAGIAPFQRLLPAAVANDDHFAASFAQSNGWLAVSAPRTNGWRGVVYLYQRTSAGWTLSSTLTSPDSADEYLGYGLALEGTTLALTARKLNADQTDYVHRVHVLVRSGTSWTLQHTFDSVETGLVELSGDTLVMSVADESALGGKHVAIYRRSGSTWSKEGTLFDELDAGTSSRVYFASSIKLDGNTLAVTSITGRLPGRDGNDRRPISVVDVYTRTGSTWSAPTRLAPDPSTPEYSGDFGAGLALEGDTLVVGAPLADGAAGLQHAGSVTIYVRSGTSWQRSALVHAVPAIRNAQLGEALDISGDRLVAGAPSDGTPQVTFPYTNLTGAAYLFDRGGTAWTQTERVTSAIPVAGADFGTTVALEGSTLVINAWQESEWREITPDRDERWTVGAIYAN